MPSFEAMFQESKGLPVIHNGRTIQLVDRLSVSDGQQIVVVFESVEAEWRQGVCLTTDLGFLVNNQMLRKSIVLWRDTAPQQVQLRVRTKRGECQVKNVWDTGDGVMQSWHNGAAMVVEELVLGRRYRCNDGWPDEDFNDVVFRIELPD